VQGGVHSPAQNRAARRTTNVLFGQFRNLLIDRVFALPELENFTPNITITFPVESSFQRTPPLAS
jgi:hypothetical protein